MAAFELVWPDRRYLSDYAAALERGWSPDNVRGHVAATEELARIQENPDTFLLSLIDREAKGPPIVMPDGSTVQRLPGYRKWLWDGDFCGAIGFRWQRGSSALPPTCLGHIGFAVVPWKRRRGYATEALRRLLPEAAAEGLKYVELTTDEDNLVSQKVVTANGGILVERFTKPLQLGGSPALRYRIFLAADSSSSTGS